MNVPVFLSPVAYRALKLRDILEAIERIEKYSPKGREAFERDELIQVWMVRHLEIIGEACRTLSEDALPWALSGLSTSRELKGQQKIRSTFKL